MLDIRYKTFLELAKQLNYTKAAKRLNYTQPTVTKHIQYIENRLQVKLVYSQGREVKLTHEGILLRDHLYELLDMIEKFEHTLARSNNRSSSNIGTSRTVGEYYIPLYTKLLAQNRLHFNLLVENTDILLGALEERSIDCALISGPVKERAGMIKEEFFRDQIVLVCSPNHNLAGKTVDLADLFDEKLTMREHGSGLLQSLTTTFYKMGIQLSQFNQLKFIGNIRLTKEILYQGERLGFLYFASVREDIEAGKLATVTIRGLNLWQPYYMVYYDTCQACNLAQKLRQYIVVPTAEASSGRADKK